MANYSEDQLAVMIKIVALNADDEPDESAKQEETIATREAQEAIAENEYIRAIKLKSEGKAEITLNILKELLTTQVLNEVNNEDKLRVIKYNCHKNIAIILEERCEYEMALQHYISAILIDNTDVYTLHKFGQLALKCNSIDLAEYAFENCLKKNPTHWRAAEGMLHTLSHNSNIIGSYNTALKLYRQDPTDTNAIAIMDEITKWFTQTVDFLKLFGGGGEEAYSQPPSKEFKFIFDSTQTAIKKYETDNSAQINIDLKKFCIDNLTWSSVGKFIVDFHTHLKENGHELFLNFSFKDVINDCTFLDPDEVFKKDCQSVSIKDDQEQDISTLQSTAKTCGDKTIPTESCDNLANPEYNNDDSDSNAKSDGGEQAANSKVSKPRRRCSDLHFLEQWGWHKNRRYSARKKVEKEEIDNSLNSYLRRIFSKYMTDTSIERGKWPFNENSNDGSSGENSNFQCVNCSKTHTVESFQKETQCEFGTFLQKIETNVIDLMVLIFQWLKYVSKFWNLPVPEELKQLYIDIFELYMSYYDLSSWNQLSPATYEVNYRICMFFLEISAPSKQMSNIKEAWQQIFHHLCFNIGSCKIISSKEIDLFELRLAYMKYLLYTEKLQYEECLMCLERMALMLEDQSKMFVLHLPNLGNICINTELLQTIKRQYRSQIDINNIPSLYKKELWPQLAAVIIGSIETSKNNYENESWLKDFRTIIQILLESFWRMASYEDCLVWSEKCFHYAVSHYLEETKSTYQKLLADLINYITSYLEAITLNESSSIATIHLNGGSGGESSTLSRMIQNIIRILVYQFEGTFEKNSTHGSELDFKRMWVILHQLILREEENSQSSTTADMDITSGENVEDVSEEYVPNSFMILFTAHEYLGKRQWCSNDNGEFLQYILDAVVVNLKAPIYDNCRDVIYEYIEQVTYCLFKYPQKKARSKHLEDHEATPIKLTWPKAAQIFDLYQPEHLPEFNSYKLESITSDMEQMLLKIISLMPKELDPYSATHSVVSYIEGQSDFQPKEANGCLLPYKIINLYYLLADFYFKNRDFTKAVKYYLLDLAVNPTRFDSWAGMALSKASQIETKLNGLDQISVETLWEECEQVIRCFDCCISLNRYQTLLWIEYGSFCYTIHAYLSRYLKYTNTEQQPQFSLDSSLESLEQRKKKLLNIAHNCFSLTNSLQNSTPGVGPTEDISAAAAADANDEKWLCQYMLGKISEKRKEEPKYYLNYYLMAANYLYESNATYPIKINHSNPTALSVEALEVFYRINAAIMKYIAAEKTISRDNGDLFKKVLINLSNSPFAFNKAKVDGNSLNILKRKIDQKCKNSPGGGGSGATPTQASNENDSQTAKLSHSSEEQVKPAENAPSNNEKNLLQRVVGTAGGDSSPQASSKSTLTSSNSSVMSEEESSSGAESETDSDALTNDGCNNGGTQKDASSSSSTYGLDELATIYKMAVQNMEECATRFPEHYKSIYRLIYHFMNSPPVYRDLAACEKLLMGQYKTSLGNIVNGLFYERKNNNLFNGIWRIPSSEIDRPGSFSEHLVKCVKIFILLLWKTNNYKILMDIALNLYKTPDVDKRYIADAARKELFQQCIAYSVQILRDSLEKYTKKQRDDNEILNLLIDIYKIHKKCIKYMNQKEPTFTKLLVDVYKFFIADKVEHIPDNCNLLDLAIKLCLQEITTRKALEKDANLSDCIMMTAVETTSTSSYAPPILPRTFNIPGINMQPIYRNNNWRKLTMPNVLANKVDAATNSSNLPEVDPLPQTSSQFIPPSSFYDIEDNQSLENAAKKTTAQLFQEYYAGIFDSEKLRNIAQSLNEAEAANALINPAIETYCGIKQQQSKSKSSIKTKKGNYNKPYQRSPLPSQKQSNTSEYNDTTENALQLYEKSSLPPPPIAHNSHIDLEHISKKSANEQQQTVIGSSSIMLASSVVVSTSTTSTQIHPIKTVNSSAWNSSSGITSSMATPFDKLLPASGAPVKTLQQKLAERQKTCQLNEANTLPNTSSAAAPTIIDDIIILD